MNKHEIDGLVARLRATITFENSHGLTSNCLINQDGPEAADALTTLSARVEALETHNSDAYSIVIDLAASLAAAISLLEKGGKAAKKAAPSDKMFDQMLRDYKKSLDRARQALAGDDHGHR